MNYDDDTLYQWVLKTATEFYELAFKDPWFGKIFRNIEQEVITTQQTDFIVQSLGGPKRFCGRMPKDAHPHIWIDREIWDYREKLLVKAFETVGLPEDLKQKWLKIERAFQSVIMNSGPVSECEKRYTTDEIIYEPMPSSVKKKSA